MVDQHTLEQRLDPHALIFLTTETDLDDAFGLLQDWVLEIGSYRLLLNPLNGYWIYADTIHNSMEATGIRAGEALFYLEGEELETRLNPNPPTWEEDGRFALGEKFYRSLKHKSKLGILNEDHFLQEVNALHLQDHSGAWWQVRHEDGAWLKWDGTAWVEATPIRKKPEPEVPDIRHRFNAMKERFFTLLRQRDTGEITPEAFQDAVNMLRLQDQSGTWWQVRNVDGAWLKWDSTTWVEERPSI